MAKNIIDKNKNIRCLKQRQGKRHTIAIKDNNKNEKYFF